MGAGVGTGVGAGVAGTGVGVGAGSGSATALESGSRDGVTRGVGVGAGVGGRRCEPRRGLRLAQQRPGNGGAGQAERGDARGDRDPRRQARGASPPGDAAPGRLRCEEQAGADEAVTDGSATRGRRAGARRVGEIALASSVGVGQAELGLRAPIERGRRIVGEASVRGVDAVDRHAPFAGESKQRTDAIHSPEHSASPAAEDGGADTMK